MSLATFKKKSINKHSSATKHSAKEPGGYWLTQGPFGNNALKNVMLENSISNYGNVGFSLNGSRRSISVGKDMKMSNQGTKFKGQFPKGNGGRGGQYYHAIPVMNSGKSSVDIEGNQYKYIKPTTTTTKNMIRQKYKGIFTGTYPNTWVQPVYTGNQTYTSTQGLYVQNKSATNYCWNDVNDMTLYENNHKCLCENGNGKGRGKNSSYVKTIYRPRDCSDYTTEIQQQCQNPQPWQKPFPFAVSNGKGQSASGTSINSFSNSCGSANNIYLFPPKWYITNKNTE